MDSTSLSDAIVTGGNIFCQQLEAEIPQLQIAAAPFQHF